VGAALRVWDACRGTGAGECREGAFAQAAAMHRERIGGDRAEIRHAAGRCRRLVAGLGVQPDRGGAGPAPAPGTRHWTPGKQPDPAPAQPFDTAARRFPPP